MVVEVIHYWKRGASSASVIDKAASVPAHEVADDQAVKMMAMLDDMGLKKRENSSQWFYSMI